MFNQIVRIISYILCLLIIIQCENKFKTSACMPRVSVLSGVDAFLCNFFRKNYIKKDVDETPSEINGDVLSNQQLNWTTNDWITKNNYSLEIYHISTSDGFNLTLHRLPRPGRRPILLVHGLLTSSLAWVIMGPANSLAFQLFNNDYDVWLANMRGSSWSRIHSRFKVEDSDFWNFSFHEWGRYDLPVIVDHIRNESSFQQILLIGHSQAFNAVLVMCSLHPQYNERLQFVQALAPTVALNGHIKVGSSDIRKLKFKSQDFELMPRNFMLDECVKSSKRRKCFQWLNLLAGYGQQKGLSNTLLYGQLLQGGSIKEVRHLQQIWKSGDFAAYDYEPAGNLLSYNSVNPLNYELEKVLVPITLYFGETDALASPAGVHHIYAHLLKDVRGVYRIAASKFNHLDFLISSKVKTLVNNRLLQDLENFLKHQLKYVIE